jgi:hypothetical protein
MNWLRLLEIIEAAKQRVTTDPKRQNGYQWACYCRVCCDLRRLA